MARRLTLVAGAGSLPVTVAAASRMRGDHLQVVDLTGGRNFEADDVLSLAAGDPAGIVAAIEAFGSTHVVLAGAVHLPESERRSIAQSLASVEVAQGTRDTGLAGVFFAYFAARGISVIGAHQVAKELVAPQGPIAGPRLGSMEIEMARHALRLARKIGVLDLGQAIVTLGERPIAAEDVAGTDALLARVGALRAVAGAGVRAPLILAKAMKPRQPKFVDLPAIGPATIHNAAAAGIGIVAIEAGRALVLDRSDLAAAAEGGKVSVVGLAI